MDRDWQNNPGGRENYTLPYPHYAPKALWTGAHEDIGLAGSAAFHRGFADARQGAMQSYTVGRQAGIPGPDSEALGERRGGENRRRGDRHEEGDEELLGLVVQFEDPTTPVTTTVTHKTSDTLSMGNQTNPDTLQKERPLPDTAQPTWASPSGPSSDETRTGGVKNEEREQPNLQQSSGWVDIGAAFERWRGVGASLSLTTGQDVANFLIQHYKDTVAGKQSTDCCVRCQSSLSCLNCGWSTPEHHSVSRKRDVATDTSSKTALTSSHDLQTGHRDHTQSEEVNDSPPQSPSEDDDNDDDNNDDDDNTDDSDDDDSPGSPPAVYECQICQSMFPDPGELTLHLQSHLDDILHKCEESRRQAGFRSPGLKAPKIHTQTTQAGEGTMDTGSRRGGASRRRKRTHSCQTGSDVKEETAREDVKPRRSRDVKRQSSSQVKQKIAKTRNIDSIQQQKKVAKQTIESGSAAEQAQLASEGIKSEGGVTAETETKPRGFSMIRWRQQRGEGLVAGQPTRCTQTPASDPLMPFVCLQCDAKFEHEHRLVMHLRKHTGERPYRCTECNATFAQSSHLKQHQRTHTGEKPHACPHCLARFARSGALASHINIHTGEKPHKCELCPAAFSHRTTLSSHMKVHTGAKPYLCPECGRTFAHTSNLKKHRITHTGLRPYICHQCSKAFSDPVNLKRHIRTHTGIKPYKCDQCLKAFGTSDALKVHMRTHSGERPYPCQHCPKAFTTYQSLTKHIGTQHRLASDLT